MESDEPILGKIRYEGVDRFDYVIIDDLVEGHYIGTCIVTYLHDYYGLRTVVKPLYDCWHYISLISIDQYIKVPKN